MNKAPDLTIRPCRVSVDEMKQVFTNLGYKGEWKQQKKTWRFESSSLDATFWVDDRRLGLSGTKAADAFELIIPEVSGTQLDFSE